MKFLFLITLMSLSSFAWSAKDWKVVAETTVCDEKIQIMGKDGEKYVLAVKGDEKTKLFAKDGSSFKEDSMSSNEFTSPKGSEVSYSFTQPSYVEANPPKIDVTHSGMKKRCKMELSR
jgi:hypothetical protein